MRTLLICIWAVIVGAVPASAQETALRSLVTADEGKGWEAVGRLNLGRTGFCTGALIAPHLVLTAAHCVYDKHSGARIAPERITFLAGWRNGQAVAYREVQRGVVHPEYEFHEDDPIKRVAYDLALLELDRPIRLPQVQPFPTARRPARGDAVGVVSYAHDRSEAPSIQEICNVKARQSEVVMLSCEVDFGASGAPVFVLRDGQPQVVSVVSSKAETLGGKVSLGAVVDHALEDLHRRLENGEGIFARRGTPTAGFGHGTARTSGNAKFLRP